MSLVIEAKNQNQESLHKKDGGQHLTSLEWYGRNYQAREAEVIPVVAASVTVADEGTEYPETARVLTPDKIVEVLDNLKQLYLALANEEPLMQRPKLGELIQTFGLLSSTFVSRYTVRVQRT